MTVTLNFKAADGATKSLTLSAPVVNVTGFKLGQVPFAASSPWNTPIKSGATYTALKWPASNGYNYGANWDQYSPAVYVEQAGTTDPMCKVTYPANWGYSAGSVIIPIPAGVTGAVGTDGELIIIWNNIVYNLYGFNRISNTAGTCADIGLSNVLTDSGWGTASPFLGAGTTAVGASEFGGLLVQAETDTGVMNHALQIAVDTTLANSGFVAPAIAGDGGASNGILVEGQRLAIPPSTSMPTGLSQLGQVVFKALQKYGAYVIDTAGWTSGSAQGGCGTRMQANAYSAAIQASFWTDVNTLFPMLHKVS